MLGRQIAIIRCVGKGRLVEWAVVVRLFELDRGLLGSAGPRSTKTMGSRLDELSRRRTSHKTTAPLNDRLDTSEVGWL